VPENETVEETVQRVVREEIARSQELEGREQRLAQTLADLTAAIAEVVAAERGKRDQNVS
jgi:hypothetical protein